MFGFTPSGFICHYQALLKDRFAIELIDMNQFIPDNNIDEVSIHNAFIKTGMAQAVESMHYQYLDRYHILAFSIGRTIAWKACLKGLKANSLSCVSATRLRYESQLPHHCRIKLYFGEDDNFKPQEDWALTQMIPIETFKECGHEMYKDEIIIKKICTALLDEL